MLDTMLDLFYLFIFVAGAAGLGAIKRAGRKLFTSGAEQHYANLGGLVRVVVPVEERRPGRITVRRRQWVAGRTDMNQQGNKQSSDITNSYEESTIVDGHHLARPIERVIL